MTCLPLFIVTVIVVYSINVAVGELQLRTDCSTDADCDAGLECSREKCLIPYDSDEPCKSGFDCVHGVWCSSPPGGPWGCRMDFRCKNGECDDPATECEDGICARKEGERCTGPCKQGLTCRHSTCRQP
uniref:Gsp_34 putative toxin n=1 Tax=Gemmula speciosa TaxID=439592 RepID=A0A098LXT1_GEMSP